MSSIGFSQDAISVQKEDTIIETIVDEMAQFPGGRKELLKFLVKEIDYNRINVGCSSPSGKLVLKFVIEKNGAISNISIVRGLSNRPEFDQEAIRVVKLMPNWIPAKTGGEIVRSYFILPIEICTE